MATTFNAHAQGHQGRISKYKARSTVRPILKKLHSSHSEKNSLDLDRGWEEQHTQMGYTNRTSHDNQSSGDALFGYPSQYSPTTFAPTARQGLIRDVSFDLSTADLSKASTTITTGTTTTTNTTCSTLNSTSATSASSSTAAISNSNSNNNINNNNPSSSGISSSKLPYHHTRSTSGTSQFSVATSNSGRNGSFVHPFQQTPRTSSPPLLSYAASLASLDNNPQRDYPPDTITENEDDNIDPLGIPVSATGSSAARVFQSSSLAQSQSHSTHRGPPPAGNQRASSMSDAIPTIRAAHGRTSSGSIPRLVTTMTNASGDASPSIHGRAAETGHFGNITPSVTVVDESPLSAVTSAAFGVSPQMSGTSSSNHAMSQMRSSLDMANFRLRSRSDVDTATRQEHVRAARRKFEEKERAKDEKYAREQSRKRERADSKEAQRLEKAQSRNRGSHSARNSTSDPRPSFTRKSTNHSRLDEQDEKISMSGAEPSLSSRLYDEMPPGSAPNPRADDVHFESSKRNRSGKRKTTGAWTAFVLWFRTRLLKLGRR